MKINSNTIKLEKKSYQKLEEIIKKIASKNKIENVENIEIKLSKESGIVKFAIIDDWADNAEDPIEGDVAQLKEMMNEFQIDAATAEKIQELISSPATHNTAEDIMREINNLIDGHGVEAIRKEDTHVDNYYFDIIATYINTGDTYNATIVHDSETGEFHFTTYGDFLEKWELENEKDIYDDPNFERDYLDWDEEVDDI